MSVARKVPAKSILPKVISIPNALTKITTSMFATIVKNAVSAYRPARLNIRNQISTEAKVSSRVTTIRISFIRYSSSFNIISLVFWYRPIYLLAKGW